MADDGKVFELCAFCPSLCMDRCPVVAATGNSAWTPQAKMMAGWLHERGFRGLDAEAGRTIYQCTGCMSCRIPCLHEIDVEKALFDLRARLVKSGVRPFDESAFSVDDETLAKRFLELAPEEYMVPEAGAALFPGVGALLHNPGVIRDVFNVFGALGIDTVAGVPSLAVDSGYDLYAAGFIDSFREFAGRVGTNLRRYRRIVVLSPVDFYTITVLYPLHGVRVTPEVLLASDLVGGLMLARKPVTAPARAVAYHDSCIGGRHLERYDMPRKLIEHVVGRPAIELRRHHADSMCCGAGGAWAATNPAGAAESGRQVALMARDAGAEMLVMSGCNCVGNVANRIDGLTVVDLVSFVARALGL
ncbi:MAG TPA: (Fe-S)-binding protein [Myxococcota bacterium]|nr:(Fe-S)-binding protein [Myxococcota bacterium]